MAESAPDAWVSAPGPTFADACELVAEGAVARDRNLTDRVRERFAELAAGDGSAPSECTHNDNEASPPAAYPLNVDPTADADSSKGAIRHPHCWRPRRRGG